VTILMQAGPDLSRVDERQLLAMAREQPDGPAFRALFERLRGPVVRLLLGLVRDRALADDLLQETFLRVHQHLDRFDPARQARPWVLQIARNLALNALRARRKGEAPGDDPPERAVSDRVLRQAEVRERVLALRAALAALDDEQRALLLQRHGLGMRQAELAASWGCTERTIRNRLVAAAAAVTRVLAIQGGAS
jgi:RNA polymerase sigma-70 factor (ECF subfamily)